MGSDLAPWPTPMLRPLLLLLPALIPSWKFFDWIAPSPRIEYVLLASPGDQCAKWQEFRPRPERISMVATFGRLFFNPRWNETLFLVSCAERQAENPTEHSSGQIFCRIAHDLPNSSIDAYLRYRLVFVYREGDSIESETRYVSEPRRLSDIITL